MRPSSDGLRAILRSFKTGLTGEHLEIFGSVTYKDVHHTIASIQARQEVERAMMDMTRVQSFLDRTYDMAAILRDIPGAIEYTAFVWGPFIIVLNSTCSDMKAFDIVLDAYNDIGRAIPVLRHNQALFASHPGLWKGFELIYQDVLEFQHALLGFSTNPNMRILFRSMWHDYLPRFKATLETLEMLQTLAKQTTGSNEMTDTPASQDRTFSGHSAGNDPRALELHDNSNLIQGDVTYGTNVSEPLTHIGGLEQRWEATKHLVEIQMRLMHAERMIKIQEWIVGSLPHVHQDRIFNAHLEFPETGVWVLDNPLVRAWMKDDLPRDPVLWINGIPGAGKTVLASILIDACKKMGNSHTAFFYCQYDDRGTNTTIAILKGLLTQAVTWRPELMSYFDEQRKQGGEPVIVKEQTARRLFNLTCYGEGQTYLVIDGIDACSVEDQQSTLAFLRALVQETDQNHPGKLRLLITSQNEPYIRRALRSSAELQIGKNLNGCDIEIYVKYWTERIGSKFDLEEQEVLEMQIETCRNAAGQFLYAELVMKNLYHQPSLPNLREAMRDSEFPRGLSAAYEKIIKRMREYLSYSEWDVARQLLGWMVCAARPLQWHEMQGALSIDFNDLGVDFESRSLHRHVQDLCGALILVHDDRISLVHRTALEFIKRSEYIDYPLVECQLANLCIRYLELPCFDADLTSEDLRYYLLEGHFAFADYAAAKWMYHLYRVAEQAAALADRAKWDAREVDVNVFLQTVQVFTEKHHNDFRASQSLAELRNIDAQLDPTVSNLLDCCSVENAKLSFQQLWTHTKLFYAGNFSLQQSISFQILRTTIKRIRELLEEEFSNKRLAESDRKRLEKYYGERVYRCPSPACFFFHQGFTNRVDRDRHIARHERPFECLESDCPASEFGFEDKRALQAHMRDAHPDSESKATIFGKPVFNPLVTNFRCEKCDRSFARYAILQAHQRAHAGQKPYECSRCGKGFVRKWDCTRHEKSHENRIRV